MAIQRLSAVPRESLVGKFICTPSRYSEQEFGWPAVVEKTTAARMTYRRLPRGAWDPVEKEWQVRPTMMVGAASTAPRAPDSLEWGESEERSEVCNLSSVKFVCDTAQEAIALYVQALATRKTIEAFRKDSLAKLDAQAMAGELPTPPYLAAPTS
ncbi:hypothetical protein WJ97_14100 [Burkholderia ubonensis]|uniref:hypothetical protein n=1 Tax=Burkholderia ubonensis TaxID=101571 RepID=UPI00075CF0B3|nr:hypothetical protein [Burkholderia ubonensis]KVP96949.1 hypothetical protein WJ97_14100 [Burkholderia ubonensis]